MKLPSRSILAVFAFIAGLPGILTGQTSGSLGLAPGDQIRIAVWRAPELSGDFVIAGNGTIIHPLYRELQVAGIPMSAVEDRIRTFLRTYQTNPQFVVQPLMRVVVGGEVRLPNVYSVPPETTIAQAIALAGGPTERGNVRAIRVIRDRQEVRMDLTRPDSDAALIQIRSGDQILITRRVSIINTIGPVTSVIGAVAATISIIVSLQR
jgi:protein involved in polysaccharide export with SLBB domain